MQMGLVKYNYCAAGVANEQQPGGGGGGTSAESSTDTVCRITANPHLLYVSEFQAWPVSDRRMTSSQILTLCTLWHVKFESFVGEFSVFFHTSTLIWR